MTLKQKKEKKGLLSRHVFLDTDAYHRIGYDLSHAAMRALATHIKEDRIVLHVADITIREINAHIEEETRSAVRESNRANRRMLHWQRKFSPPSKEIKKLEEMRFVKEAITNFRHHLIWKWKAVDHKASEEQAGPIFDLYFSRSAPFEKPSSKEFPDAFVISSLDTWCKQHKTTMHIVTGDAAMCDAANATTTLHPVNSLEVFLQSVTEAETPEIIAEVLDALAEAAVSEPMMEGITAELAQLAVVYAGDYAEGEVYEHEIVEPPELEDFSVLSASADEFSLLLVFKVKILAYVQYEDRSGAIYDREDDVYFGAEPGDTEIEDNVIVKAYMVIDREKRELKELELITDEVDIREEYDY